LHILIESMLRSIQLFRLEPVEAVLKNDGFTIPPRPGCKRFQGKPGVGQEIKLTDDEVIRYITTWSQFGLDLDARAVAAAINDNIRRIFIQMLEHDMGTYSMLTDLGQDRHVYYPPPAATAADNSLNIDEVARLWEELGARQLTVSNLEAFLMNTNDQELVKSLRRSLLQIAYPQLEQLENILKKEGFTVPPRPLTRLAQGPPGHVTGIILSDAEILGQLILGTQIAIFHHVRSYTVAIRKDIKDLFRNLVFTEINEYEKLLRTAKGRHALENPPVVTSHRG